MKLKDVTYIKKKTVNKVLLDKDTENDLYDADKQNQGCHHRKTVKMLRGVNGKPLHN